VACGPRTNPFKAEKDGYLWSVLVEVGQTDCKPLCTVEGEPHSIVSESTPP